MENEEHFRDLAESMPDAILAIDKQGIIVLWNSVANKIFGYPPPEVLGKPVSMLLPERFRQANQKGLSQLQDKEKKGLALQYVGLKKDGTEFACEMSFGPRKTRQGLYYVGIVRDVSERKKFEDTFLKAKRLESIATLAGGVSRDFNTILASILGNINIALEQVKPEDSIFEPLERAEKATLRARDLTAQLLAFSQGGQSIKKKLSVKALLRNSATAALQGRLDRCEFRLPDNLWSVEIDESQMQQVFKNLIINAEQAMPGEGTLRFSAENVFSGSEENLPLPDGKYVKIILEDQSIGILNDHLQNIFDPYFTSTQRGSGIGLAATYTIIKKHAGLITVESEFGKGTTFFIYLPGFE